MTIFKIYHNPKCSKSKEALMLLNDKGFKVDIILYMKNKITTEELKQILMKLKFSANDLLRKNEKIYSEKKLQIKTFSENQLISLMLEYPNLIQRPIVEVNQTAIIARPAEKILSLI